MTVCSCVDASCLVTEKTNAYIRDNIVKTPEDCTYVTSSIIGCALYRD